MITCDEIDAELAAATVDSLLSDPKQLNEIIGAFVRYLSLRARVRDDGQARFQIARHAPWCDLIATSEPASHHDVYGPVDIALLQMLPRMLGVYRFKPKQRLP